MTSLNSNRVAIGEIFVKAKHGSHFPIGKVDAFVSCSSEPKHGLWVNRTLFLAYQIAFLRDDRIMLVVSFNRRSAISVH